LLSYNFVFSCYKNAIMHDQCQIEQLCRLLAGIICQNEQLFLIVNRLLEAANLTNEGLASLTETVNSINENTSCDIGFQNLSLCGALTQILEVALTIQSRIGVDGINNVFSRLNEILSLVECQISIPGSTETVGICGALQEILTRISPVLAITTSEISNLNVDDDITASINLIDLADGQTACSVIGITRVTILNNVGVITISDIQGPVPFTIPTGTEFFTCT